MRPADRHVVALDVPSGVDASTGVDRRRRRSRPTSRSASTAASWGRRSSRAGAPPAGSSSPTSASRRRPTVDDGTPAAGADAGSPPGRRASAARSTRPGRCSCSAARRGFIGAPLMTALAALRASAGIAWIAAPPEARPGARGARPRGDGARAARTRSSCSSAPTRSRSARASAGRTRRSRSPAGRRRSTPAPVVIDADGLFAFNGALERAAPARPARGADAARGRDGAAARRRVRLGAGEPARGGAAGPRPRAAASSCSRGPTRWSPTRTAACACPTPARPGWRRPGSGDVLTGVVAAMLAKGGDARRRGRASAAEVHGLAGQAARSSGAGRPAIIATDVIDALPGGAAVIGTHRRAGDGDRRPRRDRRQRRPPRATRRGRPRCGRS